MTARTALIRGLRRPGNEPQLTQALSAVFQADPLLASGFVRLLLETVGRQDLAEIVPAELDCAAEEVVPAGRLDLRFRGDSWDVIVELKIHAGYGRGWFERYLEAVADRGHGYLIAVTRDVPVGEPPAGVTPAWLGPTRWRSLLPGLRRLRPRDASLAEQWSLFLDVLEQEGSMGFTQPQPELFGDFARARLATRHMEEFLRVLVHPLLDALRDVLGGEDSAGLYWKNHGRFSRASHSNTIDIPLRVPAGGPWRIRAGVIGWTPPAAFYISPAPNQRWSRRQFAPEVRTSVEKLVAGEFEPEWMTAYLKLTEELVLAPDLEEQVISWARARFVDLRDSGLLSFDVRQLGDARPPDTDDPADEGGATA